jgi:hypothetical protein
VKIARSLERQLERLFEGPARRVFSGQVHPSELAEGLSREADLARYQHLTGPATANEYQVLLNPRDLESDPARIETQLEEVLDIFCATNGLRLEGPPRVSLVADPSTPAGQFRCEHDIRPGPLHPWARLSGDTMFDVGPNRALIGRGDDCDIRLALDEVSRRHAVVHREHGHVYVTDLGSSNGTFVDGARAGTEPVRLVFGSLLTLASSRFRFLQV